MDFLNNELVWFIKENQIILRTMANGSRTCCSTGSKSHLLKYSLHSLKFKHDQAPGLQGVLHLSHKSLLIFPQPIAIFYILYKSCISLNWNENFY